MQAHRLAERIRRAAAQDVHQTAVADEWEDDLHRHVHLENNILFPKAAALEEELEARQLR